MSNGLMQKRWLRWVLVSGAWTLMGLSFAMQFFFSSVKFGRQVSWEQAISYSLSDWYVFAVLSIPVIFLARRFPLERGTLLRHGLLHVAGSLVFSLAYMVVRAWVSLLLGQADTFRHALNPLFLKTFPFNVPVYWVVVTVCHALDYSQRYHERELRTSELEARLAQAKLMALRMQINPHFLFNSLNSISALMHKNVEAADTMLIRLSELLRHTLDSSDTQEVALREELQFLERYLDIERTRFGSRLKVQLDIAPDTLNALVPNLVLQPLVENAIKHGIEPKAKAGLIQLRARRENGQLQLEVEDNGVGLPATQPLEEGVGLTNTRARLQQLYGDAHRFALANLDAGGLRVSLTLPFRTENRVGPAAAPPPAS